MDKYEQMKKHCETLSLREVMEYTRNKKMIDGAGAVFFEKIVEEIEKIYEILKEKENVERD